MISSLSRDLILILSGIFLSLSCSQNSDDIKKDDVAGSAGIDYPGAVVNVNIADLKKEPRKHAERVSQALYNEVVDVIERNKNYAKIRQWDGYDGWIRSYSLDDNINFTGTASYIVDSYLAPAYDSPDNNSSRKAMFPYGCKLCGDVEGEYLRVESARYGIIYVELSNLLEETASLYAIDPDSASVSREASKFIGAPYLWGGKSFYGIDCSGLTQIIMKRFGVDLYRDSKDQMTQGIEMLFFPHHVGLAVSKDLMIHSTGENGGVAYNSLNPESPIYSEYHDKKFVMARRVISRGAIK